MMASFGSAVLFGLMHFNLAGLPLYVAIGMILAEVYRRSGSLWVSVIGHVLNNGLGVALMFYAVKG